MRTTLYQKDIVRVRVRFFATPFLVEGSCVCNLQLGYDYAWYRLNLRLTLKAYFCYPSYSKNSSRGFSTSPQNFTYKTKYLSYDIQNTIDPSKLQTQLE